jgi:polyphosphate kinase 2
LAKKTDDKKGKNDKTAKKGKASGNTAKMPRKVFEKELRQLQTELCIMQKWIKQEGLRVVVVFEGRDAAGKGGVLKRITERVSPRVFRVVALPTPSDREKSQLYLQRYITHFPAAREVILFDRSWYNRAGVERVMGFCDEHDYERFLRVCPLWEREIVEQGIILIKYFLDVTQEEQERRFIARATDPMRHWKLSPMDIESWRRWWDYTAAYARMLDATDTEWAPWYRVQADDKRRARLNCIAHFLSMVPYENIPFEPPTLGKRHKRRPGMPKSVDFRHQVPAVY